MSDENLGINIDLNSILGISDEQEPVEQPEPQEKPRAQRARCHTERGQKMFDKRRFFSEKALLDTAEWYYQQGDFYCFISGGDVDSLTFLKHVLRQQPLKYCLCSTWCFGIEDALEIGRWVEKQLIKRIDFYVGEIAKASYAECTRDLTEISGKTGGRCGVFRNHSKVMRSDYHPTMKPVALVGKLMKNSSRAGENVVDIFGGSGSTLMAAEQLKRRAFIMELDEKFCDVIIHRWEEFTGEKAIKLT